MFNKDDLPAIILIGFAIAFPIIIRLLMELSSKLPRHSCDEKPKNLAHVEDSDQNIFW